jgi:hypothetical protein
MPVATPTTIKPPTNTGDAVMPNAATTGAPITYSDEEVAAAPLKVAAATG